jgi:hypothetical protein
MEDLRSLKPNQLDALREVANIGAGHAATALSEMIGETIMISVPRINVARLEEVTPQVSAPDEPVAAVLMHMLGDLTGRTLLVFRAARHIGSRRCSCVGRRRWTSTRVISARWINPRSRKPATSSAPRT